MRSTAMPESAATALAVADAIDPAAEGGAAEQQDRGQDDEEDDQRNDRRDTEPILSVMNQRSSGEEKPAGVPCE